MRDRCVRFVQSCVQARSVHDLSQVVSKRVHNVADSNLSGLPARVTMPVADTKNVSDFFQKHFVSETNVSRFARHENKSNTVSATMCPRLPQVVIYSCDIENPK